MFLDYNFKKLCEKTKMPKFGTTNTLFWYFWASILKHYCLIWYRHPQVSLFADFHEKTRMPKNRSKNALFGYFGDRILKHCFHIWNRHYRIFLTKKICEKQIAWIWHQKCLVLVFLGWNFKTLLSYLKSAPSNFMYYKISQKNKHA